MNIFMQACRDRIRINTNKGMQSPESIWTLDIDDIATAHAEYKAKLDKTTAVNSDLDTLASGPRKSKADQKLELIVAVLKEVNNTLVAEARATKDANAEKVVKNRRLSIAAEGAVERENRIIREFTPEESVVFFALSVAEQNKLLALGDEARGAALKAAMA